jgi:hypothetical protein
MVSLGVLLELVGDLAGRERHMRTALNLDPVDLNVHGNLTDQLIWTRRYAEAIEQSYRYQAVFVDPINRFNPTMMRAWALINSGDLAAVEGELRQARHDDAPTDVLDAAEAFAAAVAHQPERARALLSRNPAVTSTANMARALRTSFLLETAGWLGDESLAVRLLREYEVHPWYEYQITMLRLLPGLSRLRDSAAIRSCFGERGRRLVWPIEAPPLSPEDRAQFTDYSEANGLPQ